MNHPWRGNGRLGLAVLVACVAAFPLCAAGLTNAELDAVCAGFEARRDTYLHGYLDEPLYETDSALAGCREHLSMAHWMRPGRSRTASWWRW